MEDSERRKTQEGLITNCHFRTVYSCTLSRPTVSVGNGKYRCKLLRLGIDTPLCFPVCLRWLVFYRFPARMRSTNSSPVFASLETGCGNHILKDELGIFTEVNNAALSPREESCRNHVLLVNRFNFLMLSG